MSDATLLLKEQDVPCGNLYSANIQQGTFLTCNMPNSHIPYLAFNPISATNVCMEDGAKLPSPSKRNVTS